MFDLEKQFSKEVHSMLKSYSGDKAPRLDGFTMAFWNFSWDFVEKEVMDFFWEFQTHSCFVKSLNATFLALISRNWGGGGGGGGGGTLRR